LHPVHTELRGIDAADRQPVDGASGAGWPEASALAFMWQGVEDNILAGCRDFVLSKPTAHLSLHFDGVRVDRDRVRAETSSADPVGHFCELLSDYAFQRTGYRVTFVEKLHRLLIAETLASAERIEAAEVVPDELLGAGLCIPLSIARVMRNGVHVRVRLHAAGLRPGAEGDAHPALAYRDVAAALDVRLRPVLDAESLGPGVWLVHTENGGVPHCMGLVISSDEACHIFEGDRRIVIERSSFLSALRTCVDKKTVVFFGVNEVGMLPSGSLEKLLDLYAGAAPSHPTIPPAVSQPSRDQCPFDLFATDFLRDDDDGEYEVAAAGPNVSEDVAVVLPLLAQRLQERGRRISSIHSGPSGRRARSVGVVLLFGAWVLRGITPATACSVTCSVITTRTLRKSCPFRNTSQVAGSKLASCARCSTKTHAPVPHPGATCIAAPGI